MLNVDQVRIVIYTITILQHHKTILQKYNIIRPILLYCERILNGTGRG